MAVPTRCANAASIIPWIAKSKLGGFLPTGDAPSGDLVGARSGFAVYGFTMQRRHRH